MGGVTSHNKQSSVSVSPSHSSTYPEYSSSVSSSTSSSGDDDVGIVIVILLVIGLTIAAFFSGKHSETQSSPAVPEAQQKYITGWAPPNTYYYSDGTSSVAGSPPSNQYPQEEASNPYCGEVEKMAWYFTEFCRNPELATLNKQVLRLDSILSMTSSAFGTDSRIWQQKVDETCKQHQSPSDCLHSALEDRSRLLQAKIIEALASDRPAIFKDRARELWEKYKKEKGIFEEKSADDLTQVQAEQETQKQAASIERAPLGDKEQNKVALEQQRADALEGVQLSKVVFKISNQNCVPIDFYMGNELVAIVQANKYQNVLVDMGTYTVRACDHNTSNCTQYSTIMISGPWTETINRNPACNSNVYGNNLLRPPAPPIIMFR
ncbi:MAG: hypothetical protein ABSC11_10390 [Smithella sp.]